MRIALVGEALIDFAGAGNLAFQGHSGGSPLNSAVACARLGQPTGYLTQLSTDLFGEHLLNEMQANGIDTRFVTRSDDPSTIAFVQRSPTTNRYAFYAAGSADSRWQPKQLPELPETCRFVHFGSISLLQDPAASSITDFIERNAGRRVIVFDPNVRLSLIKDLAAYRRRVERWLKSTDLLKLSDEDVETLVPGASLDEAGVKLLEAGPKAVVITRGGEGAVLYRKGCAPMPIVAPKIKVADTIGAGDTFTAGLSVALLSQGVVEAAQLGSLGDAAWFEVLRFAATAAALNCTREGANPPTLDEVLTALEGA
ncbi:MAG: carbohydrate kinase [Propionivibrio sp.]